MLIRPDPLNALSCLYSKRHAGNAGGQAASGRLKHQYGKNKPSTGANNEPLSESLCPALRAGRFMWLL